ncbi:uncharacterized protein DNApol-eta isoform X3 [Euwallacea similis]|uniref:uncharacterized protein DNApol-eta isoform X3 n=1 Tax=Euwallacea similis TaxID=1736056 RepID=UPI00344EBA67
MSPTDRIILLIDMDCFFCQVEENLNPNLKGKPIAVVQYNQWRGGGIIAVNYPARDKGVQRHMRGDDAKTHCPEIVLVQVPEVRGKAELSKYRDAGKRVAEVLQTFSSNLQRASVDEAYMDITAIVEKRIHAGLDMVSVDKLQNTYVVGNSTVDFVQNVCEHREYDEANFKLALGGVIAEEVRAEIFKVTDFEENNRKAKQMIVSFAQDIENTEIHSTKSHPLNSYEQSRIFENAMKVLQKNCMQDDGTYRITYLGVSAGNFQDFKKNREITSFFEQMRMNNNTNIQKFDDSKQEHFLSEANILTKEDCNGDVDDDKVSIYSADTEEDENDVNSEDLIYFEQINPESLLDENFEFSSVISTKSRSSLDSCREHSDAPIDNSSSPMIRLDPDLDISQDSISNEFNKPICDNTNNGDQSPVINSFFTRYFSHSLKRNFDTSKIFEDATDYDSTESDQPIDQCSKVIKNAVEETIENQRCPECGKYVDQDNFQSHYDYHVALRIVKSETHLYKNSSFTASTSTENQVVPKSGPKNTKKRKIEDVVSSQKSISKYFSASENVEGLCEICQECNKPVLVSEWNVHKDYHTAKRIHLELNSISGQPIIQKAVAAKPKSLGQRNILGFFKSAES